MGTRNARSMERIRSTAAQIVLHPLKLACQTGSSILMVSALDCIGKLISYSFFKVSDTGPTPEKNGDSSSKSTSQVQVDVEMGDKVTGIICDCFADAACPDAVQLQIIKALLALILAPTHPGVRRLQVHQSSLLRAVRSVYNILLLSKSPTNQAIAQGTLTQIVSHVFGRVEKGEEPTLRTQSLRRNDSAHRRPSSTKPQENETTEPPTDLSSSPVTPKPQASFATSSSSAVAPDENVTTPLAPDTSQDSPTKGTDQKTNAGVSKEEAQVTLEYFEKRNSFDGVSDRDVVGNPGVMNMQDYYVKDAFLVFRALCKLSMKPLGTESEKDLKSHAMRSKLLSLHLILSILNTNLAMFTDPNVIIYSSTTRDQTPFIQAIKNISVLA